MFHIERKIYEKLIKVQVSKTELYNDLIEKNLEHTTELQNIIMEQIKLMSKDLDEKFIDLETINMEKFSDLYRKISRIGCSLFETRDKLIKKCINKQRVRRNTE